MGQGAAEGGCATCVKYMLVIFNIFFCFIGGGLIIVGVLAYMEMKNYTSFFEGVNIQAPTIVLILFGCITFIVAAVGCIGAFKESPCLLFVFAGIIGGILTVELVCGVVVFVFRDRIYDYVTENAGILMTTYNETSGDYVQEAWDTLHEELECCGANGRSDWMNTTVAKAQGGTVPASCQSFNASCIDSLQGLAGDNIIMLGAAAVGFGCIQMTGIVLACILGCSARKAMS